MLRRKLTGSAHRAALWMLLIAFAGWSVASSQQQATDSGLVETAVVAVAELRILVTDRSGRAIDDLRAEEVRVFEGGVEQRVAFLEPVRVGRSDSAQPTPSVLYDREGEHPPAPEPDVLPVQSVRRLLIAFDVRNSRKQVRERWRLAARDWVADEMRYDDRVGLVVLGSHPEWIVEFTGERGPLLQALDEPDLLKKAAPNRDQSRYMSRLMTDIRNCQEAEAGRRSAGTAWDCSYQASRSNYQRWSADSRGSVENLRALVAQLSAVPDATSVMLFSEGIIDDPAMMAVNAMVASFGSADKNLDVQKMKWRIGTDVHRQLDEVHRLARASGVSFFSLNSKERPASGLGWNLENTGLLPPVALGIDPWVETDTSSRSTLELLSRETGGVSFLGFEEIGDHLQIAADSWFGMYTVGYYRANPDSEIGKVRVEIDRAKLEVHYRERAEVAEQTVQATRLDLTIGRPEARGGDQLQALPIVLSLDFDALPLRGGPRSTGTVLGLHVQAVRPDGTIAAERLDVAVVELDEAGRKEASGKPYVHRTELLLAPGAYRLRARVRDDRLLLAGDSTIDLTLEPGGVRPGLSGS